MLSGWSLFIIAVDSISLASSISLNPGAIAISKFGCLDFIIFINSLKCGHFLCGSCGEQKGKSKINFLPKYLLTILSTFTLAQVKSGFNVYLVLILELINWTSNLFKTDSLSKSFFFFSFF